MIASKDIIGKRSLIARDSDLHSCLSTESLTTKAKKEPYCEYPMQCTLLSFYPLTCSYSLPLYLMHAELLRHLRIAFPFAIAHSSPLHPLHHCLLLFLLFWPANPNPSFPAFIIFPFLSGTPQSRPGRREGKRLRRNLYLLGWRQGRLGRAGVS